MILQFCIPGGCSWSQTIASQPGLFQLLAVRFAPRHLWLHSFPCECWVRVSTGYSRC
jgi:hypothetical protein